MVPAKLSRTPAAHVLDPHQQRDAERDARDREQRGEARLRSD
jgi:hypothetical protein